MKKLILIGAGGHAKSVADSINKSEYELCGFIDSNKKGMHMGLPILGTGLEDIPNCEKYSYFVSIGDVGYRKLWFDRIRERRLNIINIIDSSAIISASAKMGIGNFVGKMAVINADAEIGNNNVINTNNIIATIQLFFVFFPKYDTKTNNITPTNNVIGFIKLIIGIKIPLFF